MGLYQIIWLIEQIKFSATTIIYTDASSLTSATAFFHKMWMRMFSLSCLLVVLASDNQPFVKLQYVACFFVLKLNKNWRVNRQVCTLLKTLIPRYHEKVIECNNGRADPLVGWLVGWLHLKTEKNKLSPNLHCVTARWIFWLWLIHLDAVSWVSRSLISEWDSYS